MAEHGVFLKSVTVPTYHMDRSVDFYERMGFTITYGGKDSDFTSFKIGTNAHINLVVRGKATAEWWGRVTFYVNDVDAFYSEISRKGLRPENEPQDSNYGERFFVIVDPDGHELCFAQKDKDSSLGRKYSVAGYYPA